MKAPKRIINVNTSDIRNWQKINEGIKAVFKEYESYAKQVNEERHNFISDTKQDVDNIFEANTGSELKLTKTIDYRRRLENKRRPPCTGSDVQEITRVTEDIVASRIK